MILEVALLQALASYIDVTVIGQIEDVRLFHTCGLGSDDSASQRDSLAKDCQQWQRLKVEHSL